MGLRLINRIVAHLQQNEADVSALRVKPQGARVVEQFVGNLIGKVLLEHRAEFFPLVLTLEWPHDKSRGGLVPGPRIASRL
jgi:hypothetical protein